MSSSITVSIKIRPLIKREIGNKILWRAQDDCIISVDNQYEPLLFGKFFFFVLIISLSVCQFVLFNFFV